MVIKPRSFYFNLELKEDNSYYSADKSKKPPTIPNYRYF